MKKYLWKFLFSLALLAGLGMIAVPSQASVFGEIINGFKNTGEASGYRPQESGAPRREFSEAWAAYISGFAIVIGAFFMVLVIYGGWLWFTAQGSDEKIDKAKKIIIGAIIGIAIIIGGRLIAELALQILDRTLPQ